MGDAVRVGAIDCGTNSIRLLVADIDPAAGSLHDVVRRMEVVRLGQGIDRTGVIAAESMERTLATTREYAAQCRSLGAAKVRFVATSASRDARNASEFAEGVRTAFADEWREPVEPEVVTGDEEARLSFTGATGDLLAQGVAGPYLVVDLGGGSTEFVRGTDAVEAARSVNIGCVRMTERHLVSDPPTEAEIAAAVGDIDAAIDDAADVVPFEGVRALVGLAGTVTTIAAHQLRLPTYDSAAIHLSKAPVDEILRAAADLLHMTRAQRAALPYMHPGRVDVIGAGALVWSRIIERVAGAAGLDGVIASEHDILDGIARSLVE
ncbi:Ppx/GppA phosphatase family protein [Intrasporangium chromatireducens]|uniref:Ppx/GppA phosphatase family protein n=1 Tax=Intrasporangium chromatireducens TaxID=1386088 RepID=UPI0004B437A7|nr:Ppx/GppA phosphatase family protein [Intrasporangium chromatireducens]